VSLDVFRTLLWGAALASESIPSSLKSALGPFLRRDERLPMRQAPRDEGASQALRPASSVANNAGLGLNDEEHRAKCARQFYECISKARVL